MAYCVHRQTQQGVTEMTNLTTEFWQGYKDAKPCFSNDNPYLPTSSNHMAFEAGRYASQSWGSQEIKSAHQSRGMSIRLELHGSPKAMIRIDYDRKQVSQL